MTDPDDNVRRACEGLNSDLPNAVGRKPEQVADPPGVDESDVAGPGQAPEAVTIWRKEKVARALATVTFR